MVRMTTVRPFTLLVAFLAFAGASFVAPGWGSLVPAAAAQESGAADFVRALGDNVIQVLKKEPYEGRKQKLHDIFTNAFDVNTMAKFAAGTYWRRADPGQQQEYLKLFGDYVATLYANKFGDYAGQEFKVTGQRASGDNDVAVESTIVQTNKPPVKVDFRVRKAAAGFKIVDVYVEGISLLITKRDEFTTVLAREGMGGLLTRLRSTAQG
jgi:phospholipid transport system substrate-binding protein